MFQPAQFNLCSSERPSWAAACLLDVMNNGMTPEQAIDKAFKWAEGIFAKYPIAQA